MNRKTKNALQFILLLVVGILLVYLSISKLQFRELISLLKTGNYWIAIPVYVVSISGYYFRILRWKLLYGSMQESPPKSMLFVSLCVGYLVSFAIPRLGEIVRCLMLKKSNNIPFNKSLISIVVERTIDTLTLLILLLWVLFFNTIEITSFLNQNIFNPIQQKINFTAYLLLSLGVICIILFAFWITKYKLKNRKAYRFYLEFIGAIKNILLMKQRTRFLFLTALIWLCYFLMTYLWSFTFPESSSLSIRVAFIVMVIGSIGRSVPIQGGGLGAYHFLVSSTFVLFGITLLTGNALAIVIHGAQMIFTFFTGLICLVWFLLQVKKQNFET